MKITIAGGTGAMGLIFGSRLAAIGHAVTLLDVHDPSIDNVNAVGVRLTSGGNTLQVKQNIRAVKTVATTADVLILFTKCYRTESALKASLPCVGPSTMVLSLQNGWGNFESIRRLVPETQILLGVTYISGTLLEPGHSRQAGNPVAFIGRPVASADGDTAATAIAAALDEAGIRTTCTTDVIQEIFRKLAINITTLPLAALLRLEADQLIRNEHTVKIMDSLLQEMVAVAEKMNVDLRFAERRSHIHALLEKAVGARGSMLQDVEAGRKTEIDVINGAIVSLGKKHQVPTPVNEVMVQLIKAGEFIAGL